MPEVGLPTGSRKPPRSRGGGVRGGKVVPGRVAQDIKVRERTEDVVTGESKDKLFQDMMLSECVQKGLRNAGFVQPSPVQLLAIPPAKLGFDLIVQSKSGTGKTAVYVVTALEMVKSSLPGLQALVLAPTREIAIQGVSVAMQLGSEMPDVKMAAFIGGVSLAEDKMKCKTSQLCVGTPGRLKQLISEGHLVTDSVRLVVLDEADKLLEPAFLADTTAIMNMLPRSKQVLALSATYPDQLARLAERFMRSPQHIRPGQASQVLTGVSQFLLTVQHCPAQSRQTAIKHSALLKVLSTVPYSQVLVFSNYSTIAQSTTDFLNSRGFPAIFMSAGQDQSRRLAAIQSFKQFSCRILCSTDLTARGIDAENVNLVVNLEVPWEHNTYLHRIGRGGRFGSLSVAITLASEGKEVAKLRTVVGKTGSEIRILPSDLPQDLRAGMVDFEVLQKENADVGNEETKPDSVDNPGLDNLALKKTRNKSRYEGDSEIQKTLDYEKLLVDSLLKKDFAPQVQLPDMKEIEEMSRRLLAGQDMGISKQPNSKPEKDMARVGEVLGRRAASRRKQFEKKVERIRDDVEGKDVSTILEFLTCGEIPTESVSTSVSFGNCNEVSAEYEADHKVSNEEEKDSDSESKSEGDSEESDTEESGNEDSASPNENHFEKFPNQLDGNSPYNLFPGYSATSQHPEGYPPSQYPGYSGPGQHSGVAIPGHYNAFLPPTNYPGHPQGQTIPSHLANLAWYQQWRADLARQRQSVQSYYFWMLSRQQH